MLLKAICSNPVTKLKTTRTKVVEDDASALQLFFSYY